jgi:thiamine-phosphate pyrophosphorylase
MAESRLLYYITDRTQFRGDEADQRAALVGKVAEAARAGVNYVQLRERDLSGRQLEALAQELVTIVRENSTPGEASHRTCLLINSRTDVALAVGADGVHLRSRDVSPRDIRKVVEAAGTAARPFIVAISCHRKEDVMRASEDGVDFVVFAPVFGKTGKAGSPPAGLAALKTACDAAIPVLALGGVTIENSASCFEVGASGVAGIRLFQENPVEEVVQDLRSGRCG